MRRRIYHFMYLNHHDIQYMFIIEYCIEHCLIFGVLNKRLSMFALRFSQSNVLERINVCSSYDMLNIFEINVNGISGSVSDLFLLLIQFVF